MTKRRSGLSHAGLAATGAAFAAATGALGHGPLNAADAGAPFEVVLARAMLEYIPDADDSAFARRWDAVSIRAQRTRWHLAGPDASPEGGIRRAGWIPSNGRNAGVTACGGEEEVAAIALGLNGAFYDDLSALVAVFEAEGGALTITAVEDADILDGRSVAVRRMTLSAPGRAPAEITARTSCTPPEARMAQRCGTELQLALVAQSEDPALYAIAEACGAPGGR